MHVIPLPNKSSWTNQREKIIFNSPLSAPALGSSAAAFVELKRSSVQDGSDHLLIAGPVKKEITG